MDFSTTPTYIYIFKKLVVASCNISKVTKRCLFDPDLTPLKKRKKKKKRECVIYDGTPWGKNP